MVINRLEKEKISKLIFEFSVPATVGMLINAIYNIVDRLFIGHDESLAGNGLAALTLCFPVMMIIMAFGILIGVGGSTCYSIHLGRKEYDVAKNYLGTSLILTIVLSIGITVVGLAFIHPLLTLFGSSASVYPLAKEYLSIILFGTIFQTLSMTFNHFIRANGSSFYSMIIMIAGAVFNIVFDAIFILWLGMGIKGAALATVGGLILSSILGAIYMFKPGKINLMARHFKINIKMAVEIFKTGVPSFTMNVVGSVLNAVLNLQLLKYGGDNSMSAMGVVNSVQTFAILPVIGINQGVQPIVSYNYGAKRIDRAHQALKLGCIMASVLCVITWVFTFFLPDMLVSIFTPLESIRLEGSLAIRIWFITQPIVGFQIMCSNYYQAVKRPGMATFFTILRQVILVIPLTLILPRFFGLYSIYAAVPLADCLTIFIVSIAIFHTMRNETKQFNAANAKIK